MVATTTRGRSEDCSTSKDLSCYAVDSKVSGNLLHLLGESQYVRAREALLMEQGRSRRSSAEHSEQEYNDAREFIEKERARLRKESLHEGTQQCYQQCQLCSIM
mmetsp:Transcript_1310/g.2499  ORF Transcript_1310/g.2499 Transcript_1310/m.2499 type:complete len:104 (-) Transcript_1310:196-507(-)